MVERYNCECRHRKRVGRMENRTKKTCRKRVVVVVGVGGKRRAGEDNGWGRIRDERIELRYTLRCAWQPKEMRLGTQNISRMRKREKKKESDAVICVFFCSVRHLSLTLLH